MINVSTATTAELVAFYNEHANKPVNKFSDRKTAERRVSALLAGLKFSKPSAKNPKAPKLAYKQAFVDGTPVCPACGGHEDVTSGRIVHDARGRQHVVDEHIATHHVCGHEWNMDTGRAVNAAAASPERAAAIKASWTNKAVAAARAQRHAVRVTYAGRSEQYKSVREAFIQLGLPLGRHIKFRGLLKVNGRAVFDDHQFSLVA